MHATDLPGSAGPSLSKIESVQDPDHDRRRPVSDWRALPWSRICSVWAYSPGITSVGTGWLLTPRVVVTAAHVILAGAPPARIEVYAGSARPGQGPKALARRARPSPLWGGAGSLEYDFAALWLDAELGGSFPVPPPAPDAALQAMSVAIPGFPREPERGGGRDQWYHHNALARVEPASLFYDIDTTEGESGAPLLFAPDGATDRAMVVGIHGAGFDATGEYLNRAQRIDDPTYRQLLEWARTPL